MLKLKNGPSDVADAAHQAGIAESFPGVEHTLSEDGKGGPPNNGIVLGQYQSRVLDMASAYATIAASGVYHRPHFVQKVVNADGQVLFDAASEDNSGEQRIDKAVADNVTAAMQPIAGVLQRPQPGRRPSVGGQDRHQPARRHRRQPGRLDGRLHPVAVDGGLGGHHRGHQAAGEQVGIAGVRLRPAVRHLEEHDGRRAGGHRQRVVPQADRDRRLRGCARGSASAAAAPPAAAVGDGDPADASKWRRASRSRSVRRPRCPSLRRVSPSADPVRMARRSPRAPVPPGVPGPGPPAPLPPP